MANLCTIIELTPILEIRRDLSGVIASSSLPSRPKPRPILIEGADPVTFEVISTDYLAGNLKPEQNPTLTYARDKNFLYREGKLFEGVDPNSLVILGNGYIKDSRAVYARGKELEGSDPKTFEFLEYGYARDKNFVYLTFGGEKLDGYFGASFEILNQDYAKDTQSVYYQKNKITGADPDTFEFLSNIYSYEDDYEDAIYLTGYTKDKERVYRNGELLDGADAATFVLMGRYSKDKNFVYGYNGEKLSWIDATTFEFAHGGYMKDKDSVYFNNGLRVKSADSETFAVLDYGYVKDKNSVWVKKYADEGGTIAYMMQMEGADATSFETIKDGYSRDKNLVYYLYNVLVGADPSLFELLERGYARDDTSVFLREIKIQGADSATFEIIDYTYTKDKNALYARGVRLFGINPSTFQTLSCGYAKDQYLIFSVTGKGEVEFLEGVDVKSFQIFDNSCYAKDKNAVYFLGIFFNGTGMEKEKRKEKKILGADPETFKNLRDGYARDFTIVYFNGERIEGADTETFEFVGYNRWKDKNSSYLYGKPIDESNIVEMINPTLPPSLPTVPVYPIGL